MNATVCPVNPPGHDWNNGLTCRWCDATRSPYEAILSGLASRRGGTEDSARMLLDQLVAEVRNEDAELLRERARMYPNRAIFSAGLRHGAVILAKKAMGQNATEEDTP